MKRKKSLLEEVDKTWQLTKLIKEAAPVANAQPGTTVQPQQQQVQGQRAPQQNSPAQPGAANPQQVQNSIDKTMDQGMAILVQQLPAILKNFTSTVGDKDGQLDIPGQQPNTQQTQQPQQQQKTQPQAQTQQPQQVQEVSNIRELKFDEEKFKSHFQELNEGGIIGLVASAPAIMQLGGKLLGWTGKKANIQFMQKWGKNVAHAGEKLHHKYLAVLEKAIEPFMKNSTPEARHQAAEAMFMTLVAGLFAGGLAAPDVLTGVKGQELASYAGKVTSKALASLGFA
jgi:hypothetical protein